MEMKKILIDTNAYSAFRGGERVILSLLSSADIVYLSIFVIGELLAGFAGGKRNRENRTELDEFKSKSVVKVLAATEETAHIFSSIKHNLKHAGTPVPINDVWIAAHAIETGAAIVTYDKHFTAIPGLRIADLDRGYASKNQQV
jgi:tRNA(fMet)-specific endonuclease VapC